MNDQNKAEIHTGYNDLKQLEVSVEAAQKMTGSATMSLDPELLNHAQEAINDAKNHFEGAGISGIDQDFLAKQQLLLEQCQHQLNEAKK
ncbi:DUF2564 family protein [Metabacillus sp. RGM 3146]|uniref:DUF2564 family protein n=1 Tax=Metabacillus sp. RGM 3146 TaxID=3401092 RepID=UPI003B9CE336